MVAIRANLNPGQWFDHDGVSPLGHREVDMRAKIGIMCEGPTRHIRSGSAQQDKPSTHAPILSIAGGKLIGKRHAIRVLHPQSG